MTSKKQIYGNCCVYSPSGELMFRCQPKRAKWYVDRDLGEVIKENPLHVKLTFQPKGAGEPLDFLKNERKNQCVVCGSKNIDELTKHHIVPYEYRKHFPDELKQHSSLDIVLVCEKCHRKYEKNYANKMKRDLVESLNINHRERNTYDIVMPHICTLLKYFDLIPEKARKDMIQDIYHNIYDITECREILDEYKGLNVESLQLIQKVLNALRLKTRSRRSSGAIIVHNHNDLNKFIKMWRNHFITTMAPKYLPKEYFEQYDL